MTYSTADRKRVISHKGLSNRKIAEATGTSQALVCRVLQGQRWLGPDAKRIMAWVSDTIDIPVPEFFPESTKPAPVSWRGRVSSHTTDGRAA